MWTNSHSGRHLWNSYIFPAHWKRMKQWALFMGSWDYHLFSDVQAYGKL